MTTLSFLKALQALRADRRGNVATLFALAAVPLIGFVGASVDYSQALASKTAMQGATDSTALMLAKEIANGNSALSAQDVFTASFAHPEVQGLAVASNASTSGNSTAVTVSASGAINASFMQLLGYSTLPIQTTSTAYIETETYGCVLALSETADNAILLGGSTTVGLSNCSIYANSTSATALSVSGSATLSALSAGAVGGVSISSSNVTVSSGVRQHLAPLADPYADVVMPPYGGCTETSLNVKTSMTIDPGVYCNGINVNAGAVLTLNPGIYFIDRGTFSVNGGSTVTGQGVTLIFTSSTGNNWASFTINGNATINLTAPIGGATAGLVIFGDRNMPVDTSFKLNGGSNQSFGGAIYLPSGAINYSGGASTSTSCTQIIGDTVSFSGNSDVAINCSSYKTKPFGPTTLRLSS